MAQGRCEEEPLRLLVVEDDATTRDIMKLMISRHFPEYDIYTAVDGRDALSVFSDVSPAIVVTDVSMPVLDGIEMAREILALSPTTRVIAVTAHNEERYTRKFGEAGFCTYVTKPLVFSRLFEAIEKCVCERSG